MNLDETEKALPKKRTQKYPDGHASSMRRETSKICHGFFIWNNGNWTWQESREWDRYRSNGDQARSVLRMSH